jgi:hypothetical protein
MYKLQVLDALFLAINFYYHKVITKVSQVSEEYELAKG